MTYKPPRRPQFFYTTAPLPCPYLVGRTERKVVTEISGPDADALHDMLSGLVVVRERALTAPAGFWNMPGGTTTRP